jgi:hypothetical protein
MNTHSTPSILQRVPVILAVTAASYGLPPQDEARRSSHGQSHSVSSTASPSPLERSAQDIPSTQH